MVGSVTIDGLSHESLAASLLRVAGDPSQRARLHEILGVFCHQSRNTLNSLKLSLYLAKRGDPTGRAALWTDLEPRYRDVEQFIERLQTIVRPMALARVRLPFHLLIEQQAATWSEALSARGRSLRLLPPPEPVVSSFDPIHLGQSLDALVAWRAEEGPSGVPVSLAWRGEGGVTHLEWHEAGAEGGEPAGDRSESLALPLLGRVASAHGGTLSVDARDGLRLGLWWPDDASLSKDELA